MSTYFITFLFSVFMLGVGMAQPFQSTEIATLRLSDHINVQWADINNDGKLDVIGFQKINEKTETFSLIQLDSTTFQYEELLLDPRAELNFQIKDFDHDGLLDLIFPASKEIKVLLVALNKGDLKFEFVEIEMPVEEFIVHDVDEDGDEDIILSCIDEYENKFITWMDNDTVFIEGNRIENTSLVNERYYITNGKLNTFIHHIDSDETHELVEFSFLNDSLKFRKMADFPLIASIDMGDLNHDGRVDLVISPKTEEASQPLVYYQKENGFALDTLAIPSTGKYELCIGDMDLDGFADIIASAQNDNDLMTVFLKNEGNGAFIADSSFFELNEAIKNLPADINDDGDLDLLSIVVENDSTKFIVQLNQTSISNSGPDPVCIHPPVTIYDQTFFSWDKTNDDRTDTLSISYELFIQNDASTAYPVLPGYDMDASKRQGFRKVVGHGFRWFDRTYTANKLQNGKYYWGVVGVDNAYFASSDISACKGEPCIDFYTPINCFDLHVEDSTVCFNSELVLDIGNGIDSITWFSVMQGFIAKSPVLNFKALESDTIYAVYYPQIPCNEETDRCVLNYSIAIEVEIRDDAVLEDVYTICEGAENIIPTVGDWSKINWWIGDYMVSSGKEITLDSLSDELIVVEAYDSLTCPSYDTLMLESNEKQFNKELLPSFISICEGQETQIMVFENMDIEELVFSWSPSQLFDDPSSSNPYILATSNDRAIELIVIEGNCYIDTLTFEVDFLKLPTITTNGDQEIYLGERTLLEVKGASEYIWHPEASLDAPNTNRTWAQPTSTTIYSVAGSDENGCHDESVLTVNVKKSVFIPELFSPNGDGNNDQLYVYGEEIQQLSFSVYDERGSLLYEGNETSILNGWDGTYSGNELPSGTYFWTVSGQFIDGQSLSYQGKNKGSIRMIR